MADWREEARRAAQRYGFDPDVFERQIQQESNFNPTARSGAGALGIAQIMPATARGWGVNPLDPHAALNAAAKNMAAYVKQYGSVRNALVAYNAGPGRVGGALPAETRNYIQTILGGAKQGHHSPRVQGGSPTSAAPAADPVSAMTASAPAAGPSTDATSLIQLASQGRIAPSSGGSGIPTPAALPDAYKALGSSRGPAPRRDISMLINAARTPGQAPDVAAPQSTAPDANAGTLPAVHALAGPTGKNAPTAQKGVDNFEGHKVAAWIAPALEYARQHGWKGQVNSGYRSFEDQTRIWNSGVRPAARPGTSNHEGADYPRGAVDVSDAQQLSQILQASPWRKKLIWAGGKDPVHFSHPHNGSY